MNTTPAIAPDCLFTIADRCDRCNARASLLAMLHTGGQLLFCGHHARTHRSALAEVAVFVEQTLVRSGR